MKKIILTGDRPTGRLHVGHYVGSLSERVKVQNEGGYDDMYVMIADAQALTDNAENPEKVRQNVIEVTLDYLSCGLNPDKCNMFIQSQIPQLTELSFYYMNLVTVSRLQRNPTVKSEIQMRNFETSIPVGFFTYPISQAADITAFKANIVPVGEDQLPMIEQTKEIVRKFNSVYGETLVEPEAVLPKRKACLRLPGTDGKAKMSKSLGNSIVLGDLMAEYDDETIKFALLQTNYRGDINVTPDLFPNAEKHLYGFYKIMDEAEKLGLKSAEFTKSIDDDFNAAMDDDFNTALAISNLFGLFKKIKEKLKAGDDSAAADVNQIKKTYSLLGLFLAKPSKFCARYEAKHPEAAKLETTDAPEEVVKLAESRKEAKKAKNYALADEIRGQIAALGYTVVDVPGGYDLKKN